MGDISELRGLILVCSFLGSLIGLMILIPNQLYAESYEGRNIDVPSYFDAIDLQSFASTYMINITGAIFWHNWGETNFGHAMQLNAIRWNENDNKIYNLHCRPWFFWYEHDAHSQEWINNKGINRGNHLNDDIIDNDMENGTASYKVICDHLQMFCWVGYNTTLYTSSYHAWSNDDLHLLFAINFDQMGTGFNAWNIIGMLLFFQLPNVHWIINMFLNIPIWACIAYLSFIFILRVIGALFGGGA